MPPPDPNGPRYLRIYRNAEEPIEFDAFCELCLAQGVPEPSARMFRHVRRLYRNGAPHYMPVNTHDQALVVRRRSWDRDRIRQLTRDRVPESTHLEFKQEIGADGSTKKALAAMANAGGGDLIFGIAEGDSMAKRIAPIRIAGAQERLTMLNQQLDPPVNFDMTQLSWRPGTAVIVVRVRGAIPGTVHLLDGRAPIRDRATTRNMTSDELRRWIQEGKRSESDAPE